MGHGRGEEEGGEEEAGLAGAKDDLPDAVNIVEEAAVDIKIPPQTIINVEHQLPYI